MGLGCYGGDSGDEVESEGGVRVRMRVRVIVRL